MVIVSPALGANDKNKNQTSMLTVEDISATNKSADRENYIPDWYNSYELKASSESAKKQPHDKQTVTYVEGLEKGAVLEVDLDTLLKNIPGKSLKNR